MGVKNLSLARNVAKSFRTAKSRMFFLPILPFKDSFYAQKQNVALLITSQVFNIVIYAK